MTRVIHAGWCDGGPLAGQQLAHDSPRMRVPVLADDQSAAGLRELLALEADVRRKWPEDSDEHRALRAAYIQGAETRPTEPLKIIDGEYEWDEGAWRWRQFGERDG